MELSAYCGASPEAVGLGPPVTAKPFAWAAAMLGPPFAPKPYGEAAGLVDGVAPASPVVARATIVPAGISVPVVPAAVEAIAIGVADELGGGG